MSPGTIVSTPTGEGRWLVELAGEHDVSTAARLREALARVAAEGGSVVVDLAAVTFIDSSVVGVLVNAHLDTQPDGQQVVVVVPARTTPARLFDLVGVRDLLHVVESRDDALMLERLA